MPHVLELVERLLARDGNIKVTRHYENARLAAHLGIRNRSIFTVRLDRKWRLAYYWDDGLHLVAIVDRGDKAAFRTEGY